jgi:hypothetical protein
VGRCQTPPLSSVPEPKGEANHLAESRAFSSAWLCWGQQVRVRPLTAAGFELQHLKAQALVLGKQGLEPLLKLALKNLWNVLEEVVQAGELGKGRGQLPFNGPEFAIACSFIPWSPLIRSPNKNRSSR